MRSFSEWATLIGSILDHAGIHEFLANLEKMKQEADERDNQWLIFFNAWHDVVGQEWIATKYLSARMDSADPNATTRLAECLPDFLAEAWADKPATFVVRLGQALRGQVDTCYGHDNLRLEREMDTHTGQPKWRITCQSARSGPEPLPLFPPPVEPLHEDDAGVAGVDSPSQADIKQSGQSSLTNIADNAVLTPATPALLEEVCETALEAVPLPLEEQGPSAQSPAPSSSVARPPAAALSKQEVWDLVHQRLLKAQRVTTPRGTGTIWRNWYGDVMVTLDEGGGLVQFKGLADLLAIEPLAEDR